MQGKAFIWGMTVSSLIALFWGSGCGRSRDLLNANDARPVADPQDLLKTLQTSVKDARDALQQFRQSGGSARTAMFRQHLNAGFAAVQALEGQPRASELQEAIQIGRLELTELGAQFGDPTYIQQLSQLIEHVLQGSSQGRTYQCAKEMKFRKEFVDIPTIKPNTPESLQRLVKEFPQSKALHEMALLLAVQGVSQQQFPLAEECVTIADQMDIDDGSVKMVRQALHERQTRQARKVAMRQASQQAVQQFANQHLNGILQGNFVFFCRKSDGFGSPCDYAVVQSADEALQLVRQTEQRGWKWRVEAVLPNTPQGAQAAGELRGKLESENTYSVPVLD